MILSVAKTLQTVFILRLQLKVRGERVLGRFRMLFLCDRKGILVHQFANSLL